MRAWRAVAVALLILVGLPGGGACSEQPPPVRVLAAASLTDVVEAVARRYDGARVAASFGSSSALARQIRDGAPADLFLSASPEWIDFLRDAGALAAEPVLLAHNQLVCIARRGGPLAARAPADAQALLAALRPGEGIAIADEGVPAGEYARAALAHLGVEDALRSRLVGQRDVRAVLHAVEQGELAAGFVYASDAALGAVRVLFPFDPATHPPILYQAALLRAAPNAAEGRRFLAHLRGETARAVLREASFGLPEPTP